MPAIVITARNEPRESVRYTPYSSASATDHQNRRRKPIAPPRWPISRVIGIAMMNSIARSLGSLKMPTYWIRPSCTVGMPVQPWPSFTCSMPWMVSTSAHSAITHIIRSRFFGE